MVVVLDDTVAALPVYSTICTFCRNWLTDGDYTCKAFPEKIPEEIWLGENDHRKPFEGDNGIQFEPLKDTDGS